MRVTRKNDSAAKLVAVMIEGAGGKRRPKRVPGSCAKLSLFSWVRLRVAALTLLTTQPHTVFVGSSAKATSSDTYRQLSLFAHSDEVGRGFRAKAAACTD